MARVYRHSGSSLNEAFKDSSISMGKNSKGIGTAVKARVWWSFLLIGDLISYNLTGLFMISVINLAGADSG